MRIALFASDPAGICAFEAFDPDSYALYGLIADALIYMNHTGRLTPALALAWSYSSPTELELELRRDVHFHDGSPFDADDVVASFAAYFDPPTPTAGAGIPSVAGCDKLGSHRVRIRTHHPDGSLLHRLCFASIYSRRQLAEVGTAGVCAHPIGTGAYRFDEWARGSHIRLEANHDHWSRHRGPDGLYFPFIRRTDWLNRLQREEIELALNVDTPDAVLAREQTGLTSLSAPAAIQHHFLLGDRGPLARVEVRRALNHAVNKTLLCSVAELGLGEPQTSISAPGEPGFDPDTRPYRFDPELARRLLGAAGQAEGFTLKGVVSSSSIGIYLLVKQMLRSVNVELEADIIPRTEVGVRIIRPRILGQYDYRDDFILFDCDNPSGHGAFHLGNVVHSAGGFRMFDSPSLSGQLERALSAEGDEDVHAELINLERRLRSEARYVQTARRRVHVVAREGITVPLPLTGHFDTDCFWNIRDATPHRRREPLEPVDAPSPDALGVLDSLGHPGFVHNPVEPTEPYFRYLGELLQANQAHWFSRVEPMLGALVAQARASSDMQNILSSSDRVGFLGVSPSGTVSFSSSGFERLLGIAADRAMRWGIRAKDFQNLKELTNHLYFAGAWSGPVTVEPDRRLFLTASTSLDEHEQTSGHIFVFTDISGEEERVRSQAVRRVIDNLPFAVFECNEAGHVLKHCSLSCETLFGVSASEAEGRPFWELLELEPEIAVEFQVHLPQIFDDFVPELSLAQLPKALSSRGKTLSLSVSTIRDDGGRLAQLLVTLVDQSPLLQARAEAEKMRGALFVAREPRAFAELASRARAYIQSLAREGVSSLAEVRRVLHTFKGEFACYHQTRIVELIHRAESKLPLEAEDSNVLVEALDGALRNLPLREPTHELGSTSMEELEAVADTLPEATRAALEPLLERLSRRPAAAALGPLARSVEAIAETLGKRVRVEVEGAELRLPPYLEPVLSTLPHLVRNALDHGLEPTEARGAKDPVGQIRLRVEFEHGTWTLSCTDDGAGVDDRALVDSAVRKGLIEAEKAALLGPAERLELLFLDGASTREEATTLSGRGVGMAAVKAEVERAGGSVEVRSTRGRGTQITLRVPEQATEKPRSRRAGC